MTASYITVYPGEEYPEHAHDTNKVLRSIEGNLQMTVGGEEVMLRTGGLVAIPAGVPHSAKAVDPKPARFIEYMGVYLGIPTKVEMTDAEKRRHKQEYIQARMEMYQDTQSLPRKKAKAIAKLDWARRFWTGIDWEMLAKSAVLAA